MDFLSASYPTEDIVARMTLNGTSQLSKRLSVECVIELSSAIFVTGEQISSLLSYFQLNLEEKQNLFIIFSVNYGNIHTSMNLGNIW